MILFILLCFCLWGCATIPPSLDGSTQDGSASFMEAIYWDIAGDSAKAEEAFQLALSKEPHNLTYNVAYSDFLLSQGKIEKAEAIVNQLLKSHGQNREVLTQAIRLAQMKQNLGDAIHYLKILYQKDPQDIAVALKLGTFLLYGNRVKEALEVLKPLDHPQAIWLLASTYMTLGDYSRAEYYLKLFLKYNPNHPQALQKLFEVLEKEEKFVEAAQWLQDHLDLFPKEDLSNIYFKIAKLYRLGGSCDKALPILEELQQKKSSIVEIPIEKARCLMNQGQWEEGEKILRAYQRENPDEILPSLYLVHLGYLRGEWQNALQSLQALEKRAEMEKYKGYIRLEKAEIYLKIGRWEEAEKLLLELLNYENFREDARSLLLHLYISQGCPARGLKLPSKSSTLREAMDLGKLFLALQDLQQAEPYFEYLFWQKGLEGYVEGINIMMDMGYFDLAEQTLNRAEQLYSQEKVLQFTRGALYAEMGNLKEAEKFLLPLVKDKDPYAMNTLGYMWLENQKNISEAFGIIQEAQVLRPQSGAIKDSLGWAYYHIGNFKEAERWLLEARRTLPHDPEILEHLGDLMVRLQRWQEAQNYYRLSIQCGSRKFSEIVQKLQSLP